MKPRYSPFFGKPLEGVEASDLPALLSVNEGWYIEYKRDLPNAKSIAKSVSAFANTHGGWLFIGVEEHGGHNNCASACRGLSQKEMDGALQLVRQSLASHLSPIPHFDVKVVWGPCEEVELQSGFGVICVEVPQGANAPYVHSSGAIYTRVSDSSEPVKEVNRQQLDLMWSRQEKVNSEYRDWISRKPELSHGEAEWPYLRVLLGSDPFRSHDLRWNLSVKKIKEILNQAEEGVVVPFDSVHSSGLGIVARQTSSLSRLEAFGVTWIFSRGLRSEVWIPINFLEVKSPNEIRGKWSKYSSAQEFSDLLVDAKSTDSRVLDFNQLFIVLMAISQKHLKMVKLVDPHARRVHAKVILQGVLRAIPFIDSKILIDRYKEFGIPVCIAQELMLPSGTDADSFFEIDLNEEDKSSSLIGLESALWIFELVCAAVGVEGFFLEERTHEVNHLFDDLISAWKRSTGIQMPM